jgi:hypothetical protein
MADRIRALSPIDGYWAGGGPRGVGVALRYAGVNLQIFNSDLGYLNNENESRTIAEILVPAKESMRQAYVALATWWSESNPKLWGDFSYVHTLQASVGQEVSKAFAVRSLSYIGNLGDIYCDRYFAVALAQWNAHVGQFGAHLNPTLIAHVDAAFVTLDTAYQSAKAHATVIANS